MVMEWLILEWLILNNDLYIVSTLINFHTFQNITDMGVKLIDGHGMINTQWHWQTPWILVLFK